MNMLYFLCWKLNRMNTKKKFNLLPFCKDLIKVLFALCILKSILWYFVSWFIHYVFFLNIFCYMVHSKFRSSLSLEVFRAEYYVTRSSLLRFQISQNVHIAHTLIKTDLYATYFHVAKFQTRKHILNVHTLAIMRNFEFPQIKPRSKFI